MLYFSAMALAVSVMPDWYAPMIDTTFSSVMRRSAWF